MITYRTNFRIVRVQSRTGSETEGGSNGSEAHVNLYTETVRNGSMYPALDNHARQIGHGPHALTRVGVAYGFFIGVTHPRGARRAAPETTATTTGAL